MASKATDSDASSMTPSEQSEGDERSEHDSDYGSDQEEEDDSLQSSDCQKDLNIQWTGYGKKTPVLLFNADALFIKKLHMRTVGERYHMAFKFGNTECKVVRNILASHGFHEVHPNSPDFNLLWTNSHLKPFTLRCLTEFQKINHFPRSYELTRKDRLYKNINKMQQIKGAKYFDFIPTSFVLPAEYQDFCSAFLKDKGPWIVKPVASSRGRGVFLVNHPDQVPLEENIIVSKYIPNPVLIDGFKFDVRLYVAVTSYDPLLIYMYEEGLTRFATVRYEKSNRQLRNQCMHLTNYSVNKKSQDYVKNDDPNVEDYGNKWSMGAMLRYLKSQGRDTTAMMMRIEDVVIKTILSVELSIATACKMFMPNRGNCFELYGFDVLIDENLKPWLLEVNLSPSLACDSPLDMKIKANMLCDLFSLVGFVCHDPMMRATQQSRRNQEITAKMAHRSKMLPMLKEDRKRQLERMEKLQWKNRQRPSSAGSSSREKQGQGNRNLQGLNSEEIKILRRVKEEEQRCAGWIRIFPSLDSWDVYSPFLQFNTPHNLMLHQRLYPDRHKSNIGTSGKGSATAVTSVGSRSKQTYLQITGNSGGKIDQERAIESYAQALGRVRQYERRLGSRKHKRKRGKAQKRTPQISVKADKPKLVQGVAEDEDSASQQQESDTEKAESDRTESERTDSRRTDCQRGESRTKMEPEKKRAAEQPRSSEPDVSKAQNKDQKVEALHTSTSTPVQPLSTSGVEETLSQHAMTPSQAEPPADSPPPSPSSLMAAAARYNVVELLQKGCILRQEQARLAFAMYLVRVQQRLLADGNPMSQEGVEAVNEQMDLVLRFLRRAAVNLNQAFRVVVPSRKLPLLDRRRILAKQLGDFVHIYSKETEQLRALKLADAKSRSGLGPSCGELDEKKFDKFVQHASESELEEVLTTYTKLNKSASIFLGGSNFPRSGENMNKSNASANPMPTPSMPSATTATPSSSPALTLGGKRRSSFDIPDSRGVATWDDVAKARSGSHSDVRGALGHGGGVPTSVASNSNTPGAGILSSTYASAVSIYTQRLVRPRSASIGNPKPAISRHLNIGSRPTSATSKPSAPTSYTTVQPTVDTYNEQAIQDALQRLTQRQQARQYSAHNGTTPLFHELPGSGPSTSVPNATTTFTDSNTVSVVAVSSHNQTPSQTGSQSAKPSENARPTQRPPRFVTMEEHQSLKKPPPGKMAVAPSPPGKLPVNAQLPPRPASSSGATPGGHSIPLGPTSSASAANVNLQNANNTFNSFIEDGSYPWHSDLVHAYNQVTGVSPQHYHQASAGSRQLALAQEQAMRKQRMLEQSRSLMEQSKAKHQAMVAQAHSAQRCNVLPTPPRSVDLPHPSDLAYGPTTFTPKPPVQPPAGKKSASAHRLSRTSVPDDIGISFYNSLKYNIHTGQTKPRGTDG